MKFYQAVYQTGQYGFNTVSSATIFRTKQEAEDYLEELNRLCGGSMMYWRGVRDLFVDDGDERF